MKQTVVVLVLTLGLAPAAPQARPFTVAAITYGGDASLLVPIARFTGSAWIQTWPAPQDMDVPVPALGAIPRSWLGAPVPRIWTAWSASGRSTPVRVIGTARGGACEGPVALKLDRALPARGVSASGADVATLAIDGPEPVGVLAPVPPASADWRAIEALATTTFSRLERGVVDEFRDEVELKKAMLADATRPGSRATLEAAFTRQSGGGVTVVRFEATKRTRAFREYGISVGGWAVRSADGQWSVIEASARVLASDSGAVPDHVPLGWFERIGRVFWIIESVGYEGASVIVFDVSPSSVRPIVETSLGGC